MTLKPLTRASRRQERCLGSGAKPPTRRKLVVNHPRSEWLTVAMRCRAQSAENNTCVLIWPIAVIAALRQSLPCTAEAAKLQMCMALLRPLAFFKYLPSTKLEEAARLFEPKYVMGRQVLHFAGALLLSVSANDAQTPRAPEDKLMVLWSCGPVAASRRADGHNVHSCAGEHRAGLRTSEGPTAAKRGRNCPRKQPLVRHRAAPRWPPVTPCISVCD